MDSHDIPRSSITEPSKRVSRLRAYLGELELRAHVFDYIEVFYNRFKKHSSLDYQNPIQFEEKNFPPRGENQNDLAVALKIQ